MFKELFYLIQSKDGQDKSPFYHDEDNEYLQYYKIFTK